MAFAAYESKSIEKEEISKSLSLIVDRIGKLEVILVDFEKNPSR